MMMCLNVFLSLHMTLNTVENLQHREGILKCTFKCLNNKKANMVRFSKCPNLVWRQNYNTDTSQLCSKLYLIEILYEKPT